MGVILGNDDGTFKPEGLVNRAQLAVMWDRYDDNVDERLSNTESNSLKEVMINTINQSIEMAPYIADNAHENNLSCVIVKENIDRALYLQNQRNSLMEFAMDTLPAYGVSTDKLTRCY
jgi:hypothetical protein